MKNTVNIDWDDSEIRFASQHESDGMPMRVWNRRASQFNCRPLQLHAEEALIEILKPLVERVVDGYCAEFDGSNVVGIFTDAANEAKQEIRLAIEQFESVESNLWQVSEAADYLATLGNHKVQCEMLKITSVTTDDEILDIESDLDKEAEENGIDELIGLEKYLRQLRAMCD